MPNFKKAFPPELLEVTECARSVSNVDTSFLYEELKGHFSKSGTAVGVNFRQIANWVTLGDQFTHQLHPYPAKLLPHIANFFVRASAVRGKSGIVLDPFCGSGTVALEASLAGLVPFVADANPFALLLTKVKTFPYCVNSLRARLQTIAAKSKRYRTAVDIEIINPCLWYKKEHKKKLDIIARAISEVDDVNERDFFRVAFSAVAKKVSYADPAVSVPVRLKLKDSLSLEANKRVSDRLKWIESLNVVEEFARVCEQNVQRVAQANSYLSDRAKAVVVGNDARDLSGIAQGNVRPSLILTSPPYGSAQKYVRASSLSLNWLGLASPRDLSMLEGRSIGREHLPSWREDGKEKPELNCSYESLLARIAAINPLREKITRQYLVDMHSSVAEAYEMLENDGHMVFVIGNNTVCGEALCNDEFLIEACLSHGMTLELSLIDHIKSRGLMTKRNQTASVIDREAVLVFKK
ncbi:hypothetical protein [Pseudomonas asiatica]|uniref:hypothetical protein n=1 Tax=Pseudomonas asiatica TaxID=2219225 RepID=UPI0037C9E6C3